MIDIIKRTPITIDGVDCVELLVDDDEATHQNCCDLCYYGDWTPSEDVMASCCEVHGCPRSVPYYFQIEKL